MKKLIERWKKRLNKIKPRVLITHIIVTLIYPVAKTLISSDKRLLIFTDALTVTGGLLIAAGVAYSLFIRGDFDITGFQLRRGVGKNEKPSFREYMVEQKQKRAEAFNYPLFLGVIYIAVCAVLAFGFL